MKKLVLLLTVILILNSIVLVGSEDNVSFDIPNNSFSEIIEPNSSVIEVFSKSEEIEPTHFLFCESCKLSSKETNEGPGKPDCYCDNYEECIYDHFTKSTVIAYDCDLIGGCYEYERGTDFCDSDGYTLNEAFLDCGWNAFATDSVLYTPKNCNDYDKFSDWEYYCNSNEVRRHKYKWDYGCSDGACKIRWQGWLQDELVSSRGEDNYCSERKSRGCSLCGHGDYDCDFDSECSSSLYCFGPVGGALDGCCYTGEWWDEVNYRCCECSSGSCCDGCHYKSSSSVCDSHVSGSDQYACSGNCLDEDVLKRYQKQYCSGSSSSCTGTKEWVQYNYQNCISPQFCSGLTSWGTTVPTCKTAQCTSGVCCDTTCGVYNYKSSSTKCSETTEYGCPWGNNLGNDVGKRTVSQYCSGSSDSCGGQVQYGGWTVSQDCSSTQYCENRQCKSITCSSDSECPSDYWSWLECKNNDVWGMFEDRTCINPGIKESYCNLTEIYKKKEDCGDSGYVGDPYCNMIGQIFRDYATRWCEDNSCHETIEAKFIKDCLTGCTNGKCNEDICTNECSSGQTRCNGNIKQTCGNYDADSCLEWPSSTSGTGNENCGKLNYCSSNICNSCLTGFANCNENPLDACEINLLNDSNNCGSCGNVCETGKSCQNGNCTQKLQGDVDGDCKVDIFDLAKVGLAYGSKPGDANWNQKADLNMNGKVDIFDLATVGLNYGRSC